MIERTGMPKEPGPQPDPILNEGPASGPRKWAVGAVIAAVVLAVMYGVTTHRADVQDEQRHSKTQSAPASTQPSQPLPGGRTTAGAPPSPGGATKPGG